MFFGTLETFCILPAAYPFPVSMDCMAAGATWHASGADMIPPLCYPNKQTVMGTWCMFNIGSTDASSLIESSTSNASLAITLGKLDVDIFVTDFSVYF